MRKDFDFMGWQKTAQQMQFDKDYHCKEMLLMDIQIQTAELALESSQKRLIEPYVSKITELEAKITALEAKITALGG